MKKYKILVRPEQLDPEHPIESQYSFDIPHFNSRRTAGRWFEKLDYDVLTNTFYIPLKADAVIAELGEYEGDLFHKANMRPLKSKVIKKELSA